MLRNIFPVFFICTLGTVAAESSLIDGSTTKASAEIIGSSVVTSVSVVLGNEHFPETTEALIRKDNIHVQPVLLTIEQQIDPSSPPIVSNGLRSLVSPVKNQPLPQRKTLRKEEVQVQGVIDSLKTIVKEEQQKHTTTTNTNVVQPVDETPPTVVVEKVTNKFVPGSTLSGEDDDEMEATGTSDPISPSTDAIDDFAKHVVSMVPVPELPEEQDNDTATSAEVHDAIHKISGAILSFDDGESVKKPIENIVTDVLTSINSARNSTDLRPTAPTTTPLPTTPKTKPTTKKAATKPSKTASKKAAPTTTPTAKPTTTSTKPTTNKPQPAKHAIHQNQNKLKTELQQTTKKPKHELPMIIMLDTDKPLMNYQKKNSMNKVIMENGEGMEEQTTQFRLPGIPVDDEEPFSDDVNNGNTWQSSPVGSNDEEESVFEPENPAASIPIEYTTIRPYVTPPTKPPNDRWMPKRPGNHSTSANRPNEFYDDEIFGYDPYQTFFHGVYVPVVEVGTLTEIQQEESEEEEPKPTSRPRRPKPPQFPNRPHIKNGKPAKNNKKKPMPSLPDHLHRPRPSHLQYQHGAADDTDMETGLLNAHYEHAGHSYGPDDGDFISPDKLALQSRPSLPTQVRKNFTDHHDHHVQHQHGLGGGHGHGQGDHASGGGGDHHDHLHNHLSEQAASERRPTFAPAPKGNPGLEATLTSLDEEKRIFVDVHNRIALRLLTSLTNPASHSTSHYGNMVITPFTVTSSLAMLFLGARGQTAAQLDGLLQLDDMLTFNPHMMYHNITESFLSQPNTAAAIIRLLVADKERGDVLEFYKTRVQHFYEARVEEVDYKFAGHLAQSIINQMIRAQIQRHSYEMINHSLPLSGPMSLLTATFFDGQFGGVKDQSVDHMNFIHLAALQQGPVARRLFQVPAFALRGNHRAVYDKDLDATAVELPYTTREISLILIMPGKPGEFAFGGVSSLKNRLNLEAWTKLMRGFYARDSFKVVVPRFRHQSSLNLSHTLSRFGLTDMFEPTLAKFKGINGLTDLYLDQNMMHFSEFSNWEKLSDTLTESNNRNLDLIRILRPHVREHYGNYGEPMSINEWIVKTKNQQRSQNEQVQSPIPDDVSRLRMELERLKRRQPLEQQHNLQTVNMNEHSHLQQSSPQQDGKWFSTNSNPYTSYSKVRGSTTVEFRPRRLRAGVRTQRSNSKINYFRQEPIATPTEQETVLRFERPFIYVLRHNPTGMILQIGQYTEPVTEILD